MLAFQSLKNRPNSRSRANSRKGHSKLEKKSFKIKTRSLSPSLNPNTSSNDRNIHKVKNISQVRNSRSKFKKKNSNSKTFDNITHERIKEIVSRKNSRTKNRRRRSRSNYSSVQLQPTDKIRFKGSFHKQMKRDKLSKYFSKDRNKPIRVTDTDILAKKFKSMKKKRGKSLGENNNLHLLGSTLQRKNLHNTISSKFSKNNGKSGELGNQGNHRQSFYQKFLAKKMREGRNYRGMRKKPNSITGPIINFQSKSRTLKGGREGSENSNRESGYLQKKKNAKKSSSYGGKRSSSHDFSKGLRLGKRKAGVVKRSEDSESRKSMSRKGQKRRGSIKSTKSRKKASERLRRQTPKMVKKDRSTPLNQRLEELKKQILPLAAIQKKKSHSKEQFRKIKTSESLHDWKKKTKNSGKIGDNKEEGKKENSEKNKNKSFAKKVEDKVKISDFGPKPARKKREYPNLNMIRKNESSLPYIEKSKVIIKKFGEIEGFAVNTHVGVVRDYNEDRVSILLNAQQR